MSELKNQTIGALPGFSTRSVHIGSEPDGSTGAVIPPISLSTTFAQERPGVHRGFDYSRSGNPGRQALERCLASLEGGGWAFAFASGLAAETAIFEMLVPQSHVLVSRDMYGGTYRLLDRVKRKSMELTFSRVDFSNWEDVEAARRSATALLWVETPTNPLLDVYDLEKTAAFARRIGAISVCDNTFASPYLQNPLAHGFDLVVHSSTKYINGHSDVVGGAVVVHPRRKDLALAVGFLQNAMGSVPSPFDCYLIQRGLKTLSLRMERHTQNADAIARLLVGRSEVSRVYYPGLESHRGHDIARAQMRLPGGMVSVEFAPDFDLGTFFESLRFFSLAESLGGVESLIEHPWTMTHASIPEEERVKSGITPGLVRISAGIEDTADLLEDVRQALAAAGQ